MHFEKKKKPKTPSPPPPGSATRAGGAGRVRVCVYVFSRGWLGRRVPARVRAQDCRAVWVSAHSLGWGPGQREPPAHVCPGAHEPRCREPGAESHPSSGALQRRPGGAWLHVGLESAQGRSLGARLSAAAAFCGARRRNGSSRGTRPSAWPSRGRGERVSRTEKRRRRPGDERRAERARSERPCPAPGALSAFLARRARSLLLPLPPGPCLLPRSPAG